MEEINLAEHTYSLDAMLEQIPRKELLKTLNERKEIEKEANYLQSIEKEKEYNEKISNTIFGTGLRPTLVGKMNSDNPHMNYDFVSFDKIEKKDPIEYVDSKKCDYDIKVNSQITGGKDPKGRSGDTYKSVPSSFYMIKEGEIQKGKDWYLKYDPKLPEEIAEMMARYNWGDLKYMTKKSAKRDRKKLAKKGKDLGNAYGLTVKYADKNNPFIITFD